MIERQYMVFIKWFLGLFASVYIVLALINYYVDPFFIYTKQSESISSPAISKPYNELLLKLSLFKYNDRNKIIFGDSRGNTFTERVIREVADDTWHNFSIGGASPLEVVSLVEYALGEKKDINEIMLVMPLRLYVDRRVNRFDEAYDLINSDFIYLTNTLVLKASLANIAFYISKTKLKTQKQSGDKAAAWKHWVKHAKLKVLDWQIPYRIKDKYDNLFEKLRKNNIKFTIVLPPISQDIQSVYRDSMPEIWSDYYAFFGKQPETINCMDNHYVSDKDMFKDPYHADYELSKMVFSDLINGEHTVCKRL